MRRNMTGNKYPTSSPVEQMRQQMPRGNADWPGWAHVYGKLQKAAEHLASNEYTRCGEDHVYTMAALGSGHEETMKGHMHLCMAYGWCK